MPKLIDYLSDKGFDLIGQSRNQEKVADNAIDEGKQSPRHDADQSPTALCLGSQLFILVFDTILPLLCISHVTEKAAGWQHQFVR